MIKHHSDDEIEGFREEKHPTHRGIPGGNQVDGLPPELRESGTTTDTGVGSISVIFSVNFLNVMK